MTKLPSKIFDWMEFADEDLKASKILLREGIYNQSCFHSQQCAEKLLKALLIWKEKPSPKIHDLKELFQKCLEAGVVELLPFREKIADLSLFYLPTRYPDALVGTLPNRMPNRKDGLEALETATELQKKVGELLKIYKQFISSPR